MKVQALQEFAGSANNSYRTHRKRKADGGYRLISEPSPLLKTMQQAILLRVLRGFANQRDLSAVVVRDPVANARAHLGTQYITVLDVRNAFPSTPSGRVVAALRARGFKIDAAKLIARLCTNGGQLPQGAPTSNALLDIVLIEFDRAVGARCRAAGACYTRYVDNIAVSAPRSVSTIEAFIASRLSQLGFVLNQAKTLRGGLTVPVAITGVETGKSLRVRPEMVARTRGKLRAAQDAPSEELSSLLGLLAWMRRVNRRQAAALIRHHAPPGTSVGRALRPRARNRHAGRT